MLVVPDPTPLTLPFASTTATFVLAEAYVMAWLVFAVRLTQLPAICPQTVDATVTPLVIGEANCSSKLV